MIEEKKLILATKPFACEFRIKSWTYLFSTIFVLLIGYTAIFLLPYTPTKIIFSLLTGLVLVRLFVIYHDYLHKAILQNSFLAEVIFTVFGLYILAPIGIWKRSHDYHHQQNSKLFTSSIGSFPIVSKDKFFESSKVERLIYLFVRHPLTILFGYIFAFIYGMCIQSIIASPKKHIDSFLSLITHFGIGYMVYLNFSFENFLLGFLFPSFIASALGAYLFYAQHNFPDAKFEEKNGWTYVKAALDSSSYMKMSPLMNWFTANIGYHHIHHANHRIPFYRLPEVFEKMPEFQNPGITSLHPLDIIDCLKLKVWDSKAKKMTGIKF